MLGLGNSLKKTGLVTPGIVTDNLVMKHNYAAGSVVPVSDGAAHFDGTGNDYIVVPTITLGENTTWTMAYWAYARTNDNMTIGKKADGNNRIYHQIENDLVRVATDETTLNFAHTANLVSYNQWNHYAITCDGSNTLILYINGVYQSTVEFSVTKFVIDNFGYPFTSTGYAWDGYLCNIGIWSGTLTQPQVKSIMNKNYAGLSDSDKEAGGTTGTPNLVSWWNLDVETATDGTAGEGGVKDYHGSNHGDLE
jgi:hypothetical protein